MQKLHIALIVIISGALLLIFSLKDYFPSDLSFSSELCQQDVPSHVGPNRITAATWDNNSLIINAYVRSVECNPGFILKGYKKKGDLIEIYSKSPLGWIPFADACVCSKTQTYKIKNLAKQTYHVKIRGIDECLISPSGETLKRQEYCGSYDGHERSYCYWRAAFAQQNISLCDAIDTKDDIIIKVCKEEVLKLNNLSAQTLSS